MRWFIVSSLFLLFLPLVLSLPHPDYPLFSAAEHGFAISGLSLGVSDDAVYRTAYYSVNGSDWDGFSLSGSAFPGNSSWLAVTGSYSLPVALSGVGEHYVIAYSCSLTDNVWDCHDGKWQLIVINNPDNSSTPLNDTCSGMSCAADEYCSNDVCLLTVPGETYFVATNGNDNNPGTFDQPWKTWQHAFNTADAGDIVYFRGGIWYPAESLIIAPRELPGDWGGPYYGNMGTAENPIRYHNYPGETPILDGRDHISESYPSIMYFFGAAYVEFKGITVRNLPQQPTSWMAVGIGCSCCSNFRFENMVVHDIGGRGYSWFSCMGSYGITEDTNTWINCDTYNCEDPYSPEPGNGGDCFKTVNEAGAYSIFQGCRAWNCSDDGYDLSGPNTVIVNNSWSFLNGFPGALDGNGFKSGGVYTDVTSPTRIITNNIAANNTGYGYFDLEYDDLHRNNARVYNNLFYSSGTGILISDNPNYDSTLSVYRNNIIHVARNLDSTNRPYVIDAPFYYTESHNTWDMVDMGSSSWWDYADDVTVTDDDFISLDVGQLSAPRKADGSLPDVTFGHLAPDSDLIDAGTQIPASDDSGITLSYSGSAPDIGPFEFSG